MSGIFDNVRGAQFPDVVMNSGPLPPMGGLPAPLHDTPDGKYNYNSTLLGDLQPYAYGEPAYLSTQHSYLNIPHRIQKILPVIYLPEPRGDSTFRLSHSIDDGDVGFTMRLDKSSLFCTGVKGNIKRHALGTRIEPFINLPTLNYLLAGLQLHSINFQNNNQNLWKNFLVSLDRGRFSEKRNYRREPFNLMDIIHIVRHCIKPFGIMRGSEEQGGQNEMTNTPSTWPVPFVATFVLDGKEDHIVNMWHSLNVDSGEDLVLRFKPMPVHKYTLNHYYKQPIDKSFDMETLAPRTNPVVWQLIPDKYDLDKHLDMSDNIINPEYNLPPTFGSVSCTMNEKSNNAYFRQHPIGNNKYRKNVLEMSWQDLGYWHIGRTQVRMQKYCLDDTSYYHNDMVNALRHQYMMMTFQPIFRQLPMVVDHYQGWGPDDIVDDGDDIDDDGDNAGAMDELERPLKRKANFKLARDNTDIMDDIFVRPAARVAMAPRASTWKFISTDTNENATDVVQPTPEAPGTRPNVSFALPEDAGEPVSVQVPLAEPVALKKANFKKKKIVTGALLHSDGSIETQDSVHL